MIKNGLYAIYDGREYPAAKVAAGHIKLIYTGDKPPSGFEKTLYGNYVKTVKASDVTRLEIVKSYAVVDGQKLEIVSEDGDMLTVGTSNEEIAKRFHMEKLDRHDYRMELRMQDAQDIIEQCTVAK